MSVTACFRGMEGYICSGSGGCVRGLRVGWGKGQIGVLGDHDYIHETDQR